jgi:hypothetical protein
MEEIIQGLMSKVGLDHDKAHQVLAFLTEHAHKLPALLSSNETLSKLASKVPGFSGLMSNLGGAAPAAAEAPAAAAPAAEAPAVSGEAVGAAAGALGSLFGK